MPEAKARIDRLRLRRIDDLSERVEALGLALGMHNWQREADQAEGFVVATVAKMLTEIGAEIRHHFEALELDHPPGSDAEIYRTLILAPLELAELEAGEPIPRRRAA